MSSLPAPAGSPPDPRLVSLLTRHQAATTETTEWPGGLALSFSLYLGPAELPDDLVTSVRCLVTVHRQIVVCQDAHPATHLWPGGRRESGETWEQTARREVAEETGWQLTSQPPAMIGFLHFRHLSPPPPAHPYPSPDFLQVVMHGTAETGTPGWVDTEGYVLRSWLVEFDDVATLPVSEAERTAAARVRQLLDDAAAG